MAVHEKWFSADTHLFHSNILKFTNKDGSRVRPFNSLDDMHNAIVDNWNSRIGKNDYVYHLGDVYFKQGLRYISEFTELMHSLNGHKRLVLGNHDKITKQSPLLDCFEKIELWKGFKEHNFTAVHIPLPLGQLRDGEFCVHGHTHGNKLDDPHYINVCVETRNYAPVHLDEIIKEIKDVESLH